MSAAPESVQRAAGEAAQVLIQAANAAAEARVKHQEAVSTFLQPNMDQMFALARARREADAVALEALEKYITAVTKIIRS